MIEIPVDRSGEAWRATMQGLAGYQRKMARLDNQRAEAASPEGELTTDNAHREERAPHLPATIPGDQMASDPIFSRVPAPASWARTEPTPAPPAPQPEPPADSEQE
ncbi:hypothetical protein [Kitasatospora sp. NPDC050543]|uniref:hypothetical protein n=1 Tax=Kitasatospora sp. NPDC050543 TaxID=3364054 RepID=UPI0037907703